MTGARPSIDTRCWYPLASGSTGRWTWPASLRLLLWGVVMGALAVVPVLGAFVVWVPAAIFLALEGSIGHALLLATWGAVVVGGLIVFGPSGLILGPVIFTVTRLRLEIWNRPQPDPHALQAPAGGG